MAIKIGDTSTRQKKNCHDIVEYDDTRGSNMSTDPGEFLIRQAVYAGIMPIV